MKNLISILTSPVIAVCIMLSALSCSPRDRYVTFTGYAQGGTYTVKINMNGTDGMVKKKPEEIKQNIYRKTAIHRFASIEEVVDAYRFCIENPFVNGSLIEVNGGYCYK